MCPSADRLLCKFIVNSLFVGKLRLDGCASTEACMWEEREWEQREREARLRWLIVPFLSINLALLTLGILLVVLFGRQIGYALIATSVVMFLILIGYRIPWTGFGE